MQQNLPSEPGREVSLCFHIFPKEIDVITDLPLQILANLGNLLFLTLYVTFHAFCTFLPPVGAVYW